MKKIKIMLTTVAILAVVGGALAFDAKSFGAKAYCRDIDEGTGVCTTTFDDVTTTNQGGTDIDSYCTTDANADCLVEFSIKEQL